MKLSPRERRLILFLGVILLGFVAYVTLLGGGGGQDALPDLLPTTSPPAVVSPSPVPSTFVVPVGARDPFKG